MCDLSTLPSNTHRTFCKTVPSTAPEPGVNSATGTAATEVPQQKQMAVRVREETAQQLLWCPRVGPRASNALHPKVLRRAQGAEKVPARATLQTGFIGL